MKKFYFTFGSWEGYPHQSTYMIVEAESYNEAIRLFRQKYPDHHPNTLNCADVYSEKEWRDRVRNYYAGMKPAEVIRSEMAEKWNRIEILLENVIKLALEEVIDQSKEYQKEYLFGKIGTTEQELVELGVDVEGVLA